MKEKRNIRIIIISFFSLIGLMSILLFFIGTLVMKPSKELSPLAKKWKESGEYITWTSTLEKNEAYGELNIFTIQKGNPENPAILMIHGYPTMSFDFYDVMDLLSDL